MLKAIAVILFGAVVIPLVSFGYHLLLFNALTRDGLYMLIPIAISLTVALTSLALLAAPAGEMTRKSGTALFLLLLSATPVGLYILMQLTNNTASSSEKFTGLALNALVFVMPILYQLFVAVRIMEASKNQSVHA